MNQPDVMNRDYIHMQVDAVLADWGVTPSGRGTGVGDVEYWCDEIIAHKGWEQYWVDRIGQECQKAGYSFHPIPPPSSDVVQEQEPAIQEQSPFTIINEKLDRMEQIMIALREQQAADTEKIQRQINQVVQDAEQSIKNSIPLIGRFFR